jgi:mRNA-degrading endonuclease RelE of RelBE toxin-antitoxin system
MAAYRIELTEDAKVDLAYYMVFERKIIVSDIRKQLTDQPDLETKNRKSLREKPIGTWELRVGKYRVFYELDRAARVANIVSIGHKEHKRGKPMKTVNLEKEKLDLHTVIDLAGKEPVVLLTADGREFVVAQADDFEREVETLRGSQAFQRFLDERSRSTRRIPLEEIEAEIEQELATERKPT